MVASAGLELRVELADRDDHDSVLAEWERTLDDATRQCLRSQGYDWPAMPPELSDGHVAAICPVFVDHGVEFVNHRRHGSSSARLSARADGV